MKRHIGFTARPGSAVYVHQAFRCCPYAGMVTSQVHDYLEQNGFRVVARPSEADVHLINTCGSDAVEAQRTFDALDRVEREGPGRPIVVTGCLNSIEPKRLRERLAPLTSTAQLDPRNLDGLDEVFQPAVTGFDQVLPSLRNQYSGTDFANGWYHVGVSTGCLGTCSFCAIRRATGRPRSSTIDHVLEQCRRGVAEGHRDLLLVSTDVSAWGDDLGLTVVDLLRALMDADFGTEVLFSGEAFDPTLFLHHLDDLLPLFATGKWAWIGLPIQSGSQRILDAMRRTYRVEDVLEAVRRLREVAPDLLVRTDILYGFGDETEADFQASMDILDRFDVPNVNQYQQRPGTPPLQLSEDVLADRRHRIMKRLRGIVLDRGGVPVAKRILPLPDDEHHDPWLRTPGEPGGADASTEVETPPPVPRDRIHQGPPAEYVRWLQRLARHFEGVIQRKDGIPLGHGWTLAGAAHDDHLHAVRLQVRHPERRAIDVGVRRADQPGAYMASSEQFRVWVTNEGFTPSSEEDLALNALKRMLKVS